MTTKYDALEAKANAVHEHSDNIGEEAWYGPGELRDLGRIGVVNGGASRIGAADDEYIVACEPASILGLIADVKALAEALKEVTASLAWNAHGECRAIHDGPIMPSSQAVEFARAALKRIQGEA